MTAAAEAQFARARSVGGGTYVSIVVWRSAPALRAVLASLAAQSTQPTAITLWLNEVDDPAGFRQLAASVGIPTEVVVSAENAGFAEPHNRIAAEAFSAGADSCLILNPDCRLRPDALKHLESAVCRDPSSLLGPLLELADGSELRPRGLIDSAGIRWTASGRHLDALQGSPLPCAPLQDTVVAGLTGACLLVSRGAYERLLSTTGELFDGEFFAYREDAELGVRAALVGVPSILVPAARALHGRALRGTHRGASAFIDRLGVRNRFLTAVKLGRHRPGWRPAVLARDLLVLGAAASVEHSSWAGVREAWSIRSVMRAKRRRLAEVVQ